MRKAFKLLKQALTMSPILAYPRPHDKFILDKDTSNTVVCIKYKLVGSNLMEKNSKAIVEVLSQVQGGLERVYFSKTLSKAKRNYCVTRRELLAVVKSIEN